MRATKLAPWAILGLIVWSVMACASRAESPPSAAPTPARAPAAAAPAAPAAPAASSPSAARAYRPTPLNPPVILRVGTVASTSDAGIFIALEKGYFKDEGLEIETENFQTAVQMIAPLGAGQLDVATGALAAGIFNAVARDVPLRIVADKGSTPNPEWDFTALMVRKDLVDSGQVKDYPDLRGLNISTTSKGNSTEIQVANALDKGGLTWDDIQYTPLSFPDMISAFANKGIDAAIVIEPYISRIEGLGTAVRWKTGVEVSGARQIAVIMFGPDLVAERQEVARRWMIAYLRGLRDYNDAFGPRKQGTDEVVQILIKHTPIKDPKDYAAMRPAGLDPDGKLFLQSMRDDLAYYERTGLVRDRIDLSKVIDTSFQEYAAQQLGPYTR